MPVSYTTARFRLRKPAVDCELTFPLFPAMADSRRVGRVHTRIGFGWIAVLVVVVLGSGQRLGGQTPREALPTVAEASNYTDTAHDYQVEAFLRTLATEWQDAELVSLGSTVEGRPLWGLVVEPPPQPGHSEPLTVLLLGGIHSGECDGKEALLALARDMAFAEDEDLRQSLRLIFVPNFNADGNERRSPEHRPGQEGPQAGMGVRENAQGLDLNRDFVKLESPEVRALVAAMTRYDVDVLIDTHTTNGSLHGYDLTFDIPHNPAACPAIVQWMRSRLMPEITRRLRQDGFETFYYGNFDREHTQWRTYGHEPRYSTEYMGLRGKIGILAESYSYASYRRRIEATYAFVRQALQILSQESATVASVLESSCGAPQAGSDLPIRAELALTESSTTVRGYQTPEGTPVPPPYNAQKLRENQPREYQVQWWSHATTSDAVSLPFAYRIDRDAAWAVGRLLQHGVSVHEVVRESELQVEQYVVQDVQRDATRSFGHHRQQIAAAAQSVRVDLHEGDFVVLVDQPLGRLAGYLLEPAAEDGLASWNFFDPAVVAGQPFPVARIVETLDTQILREVVAPPRTERLSLEKLYSPSRAIDYSAAPRVRARWLPDGEEYLVTRDGRSWAEEAATGARRPLSELDVLADKLGELASFTPEEARAAAQISALSDDGRFALVSHKSDLFFFHAGTNVVRQLTHTPNVEERLAELSPDGSHVAFVRDNDLWVVDCETTEARQLTTDGSEEILNGVLDWVYQEELYGRGNFKAFWWNPAGTEIAFLRLDESPVPRYLVPHSLPIAQQLEETRYPKAGQPLPTVAVHIADVASGQVRSIDLSAFPAEDRLIGRVTWSPSGELWLQIFNRVQNQQRVVRVAAGQSEATTVFTEISPGWIEIRGTPHFLPDGHFLWLSDLPEGRTHLYRIDPQTGSRTAVTSGPWDVLEIVQVTADGSRVFALTNRSGPDQRELLEIDLPTGQIWQRTAAPGTHHCQVSPSGKYFIDTFSSLDSPPLVSLHDADGLLVRVIAAPTSDRHEYLDIAPPWRTTIPASDGFAMQAQILLPSGTDIDHPAERLPVLFYVYGGPQAPTVRDAWAGRNYWWHQMLCQQGFAVVLCDNRSALGRGIKDTWSIRGDLGRVELHDLQDAVGWVAEQPWADPQRIGVWGWSYGGYFTAYALTHSPGMFRCGIAGAPVTDWRNYDAIYTERYMDLPEANQEGYRSSSVVAAAADLSGHLLLIHGERDDNVHLANTLQFAHALQKAGQQFDMMIYPDNRHGITDAEQRQHMMGMMTRFLQEHLQGNAVSQ
ncbi:MAG: hypothetical protein D6753_08755 [Planctomycetota bacterium]|nr:MAG: hypothetical protein D6753_08755 [Planctomycetota bacterium]